MGRGRGRHREQRLMRKDFGNRENTWNRSRTHNSSFLQPADMKNEAFEEYYKTQGICPEGEWEDFVNALRTPLPITFRINGSGQYATELREKMQSDFFAHFSHGAITVDGELLQPPRPLPWYPDNLGWHMSFSRAQLRKLPWLSDIHEWMKKANDAGSITRQEAVSMVPPLLLDVEPHHRVLDMCAAPGSKTFQLLEALHASGHDEIPTGFVVANDVDAQRCNLLTHQTKRMCSPCLMITNHDAQTFPKVLPLQPGTPAAAVAEAAGLAAAVAGAGKEKEALLYDRILCDVPCSGDGTMRKAPDIWRRWGVHNGNGLHNMQLRIALQGIRLLKVGGRFIYSTCTFNPIEDEAVVAELLVRCKGSLRLVDVSDKLPALKRLPGLRTWKVRDRHTWYSSWEEAEPVANKLDPTMFPNAEKAALPLERCLRLLPHHQDTGGFFVAVLEKVADTGPLPEPSRTHRFVQKVPRASGEVVTLEGMDPLEGAKKAAAAALDCAAAAVAALEAGDSAAAQQALARAEAAEEKVKQAHGAAVALSQQQERAAQGRGRRQDKGGDAAAAAGAAGAGAAEAEAEAAAGGGDADMADAEEAPAAAAAEGEDVEVVDADGDDAAADPSTAPAAAADEELPDAAADDKAEAGADGKQPWVPTWVRGGGRRGRQGGGGRFAGIDPIVPVQDPEIIEMLTEFYGVEEGFPLATHLITRSADAAWPKRLNFVSDALLALLLADEREQLKITSTGLKVFERHELKGGAYIGKCHYRLAQEGLPFLLPHLTRQVVRLPLEDFERLLVERNLPLQVATAAADAANGGSAEGGEGGAAKKPRQPRQAYLSTPSVVEQLKSVQGGGAVCVLNEEDAQRLGFATSETSGALTANAPMAISIWRTPASVSVLVSKESVEQMLDKIKGAKAKRAAAEAALAGVAKGAAAKQPLQEAAVAAV